ncbi:ubiquitin-activating enzyme E1, putative [Plasmodium berghei]|uniref:Ubiquitin-activating enzyme E1, putative n=2 Tax=Plasmodium berghei TaxID=5821 RepID=A0A509APU5_PLABA|nr:ubiquitin-activating enzyme E1, putative [Plasmodium berghei ANKA]SCL98810.1 ubiquitin-activating enzyme E1, putative [Plasmodium berghei]SCM16905.1 ubiquitin-activating enzyme E1, putative [Plasmodium berghei]SCM18703.1 ubiquitin-activating enzyme E1, putative [Plasmodium berghei]SCN28139.1 ubiquitin-activating enzyme E1, putative [Plasmodium berghei]VUC58019.1 ubiquitin-activating enzyme E1, putative [Plasmodium berghei ANKA]|eukprot:XP_034423788.1 ubiquitin-activating enzyme E1, putative [Plasmodium berghei ANKA]
MNEFEKFKRQISLWGKEHQEILMSSYIYFLGSGLIIFEISKGLILSGINNLTIIDDQKICENDLKYYMFYNSSKINEYICNIIKENLLNINKNAIIKCIINNPIEYFYKNIINDDNYDILICNLSVKNNLKIEKVCAKYNKKVITCNVSNAIGYLNVKIGKHIYMEKKKKNKFNISCDDNKYSFSYYYNIALSLYDDLKKYINNVDYSNFQTNGELNKIIFLVKIYHDFPCGINETQKCQKILKFVKDKIKLTNINFDNLDKVDNFIYLSDIKKRIKLILQNNNYITKEVCNHIYIFLIVYKSFIKKKNYMPYLYNDNDYDTKNAEIFRGIDDIKILLKKRKCEDEKELKLLIMKKKKKYNFKKNFEISHFVYLFSNFFYINFIDNEEINNEKEILMENFLYFCYLYDTSSNISYKNNISLNYNEKYSFPSPSYSMKDERHLISNELVLCNDKKNLLNFRKHICFNNIKKKKEIIKQNCSYNKKYIPFFFKINDEKLQNLSYVDVNINILLEKIQIGNKLFEDLNNLKHTCSNYVIIVISGLITQEVIKICSFYLKPHVNYYFFKSGYL